VHALLRIAALDGGIACGQFIDQFVDARLVLPVAMQALVRERRRPGELSVPTDKEPSPPVSPHRRHIREATQKG